MRYLLFFLISIFIFASCGKDKYGYGENVEGIYVKGAGSIELNISNIVTDTHKVDVNKFTVEVYNSYGVRVKKWDNFSQIYRKSFRLGAGTYTAKAFYGDSLATGFDVVCYSGSQSFNVEEKKIKKVNIESKRANVKLNVVWGNDIVTNYSKYTVNAYREGGKDTLKFENKDIKYGYIPSGKIKFKVFLTDKSGNEKVINSASMDIVTVPSDDITFNFNIKDQKKLDLSIKVGGQAGGNNRDVVVSDVSIENESPSIVSENISNGVAEFVDGVGGDLKVNVKCPGGLKSCVVKVNSKLINNLGVPDKIELVNLNTTNAEVFSKLKQVGLTWQEKNNELLIDFSKLTQLFEYKENIDINEISILAKDAQGQNSDEYKFSMKPVKADFSIKKISPPDIWCKHIFVTYTTSNGNIDKMQLEYSGPDNVWKNSNIEVIKKDKNNCSVKISNLNPDSKYSFRAKYNNSLSNEASAVTEKDAQLPNSGFEDWHEGKYGRQNQPIFYPWKEGETNIWDSNNKTIMPDGYLTITSYNYKCFPAVSYSTTARTGGKSAQIMAVALSNFNTSGTSVSAAQVGSLFTGSHDGKVDGVDFESRPSQISFYYQYEPKGGSNSDTFEAYIEVKNENTVIGTATYRKEVSKSSPVNTWTQAVQNIEYTNKDLKATSIYIRFKSSTMTKPTYQVNTTVYLAGRKYNCHGGSVLLIDDLNLIY